MDMDHQSNHPSSPPMNSHPEKKFSERLEDALPAGDLPLPPDLRPPKDLSGFPRERPAMSRDGSVLWFLPGFTGIHLVGIRDIGT